MIYKSLSVEDDVEERIGLNIFIGGGGGHWESKLTVKSSRVAKRHLTDECV